MRLALLERLVLANSRNIAFAVATNLSSGAQQWVTATEDEGELPLSTAELAMVREAIAADRSAVVDTAGGAVFVEIWNPNLRLFVVGAVHAAQFLVPLAKLIGYDVTVIDPRTAFSTPARFPDIALRHDWPDRALAALRPDHRTAVVTLTHDPKIDDPALRAALDSDAFYIGALGSRRTHAKRAERLMETGLDPAAVARIRGPVGLAIGALTPAEIAISIMAEITAVLRRAALAARAA